MPGYQNSLNYAYRPALIERFNKGTCFPAGYTRLCRRKYHLIRFALGRFSHNIPTKFNDSPEESTYSLSDLESPYLLIFSYPQSKQRNF